VSKEFVLPEQDGYDAGQKYDPLTPANPPFLET